VTQALPIESSLLRQPIGARTLLACDAELSPVRSFPMPDVTIVNSDEQAQSRGAPCVVTPFTSILSSEDWIQGSLVSVDVTTTQVTPKKVVHHYRCVVSDGSLLYTVEYDQPVKAAIHDPLKFAVNKDRLTLLDADGKKRSSLIETRERVTH